MWIIFFSITTVICAIGWLTRYISCAALLWYLTEKAIPAPSHEEMKQGCAWAVSHWVNDLLCRRNRR